MLTLTPLADCRLCYSNVAYFDAVYRPLRSPGDVDAKGELLEVDDQPKHISRRALYTASVQMPTPPGLLFNPAATDMLFPPDQARHARGSLWNVVLMARSGWTCDQINRWTDSGAKQDIPGYEESQ